MSRWILKILAMILPLLTPEIKKMLCELVEQLVKKAAQTDNPWDDVLAGLLKELFCE